MTQIPLSISTPLGLSLCGALIFTVAGCSTTSDGAGRSGVSAAGNSGGPNIGGAPAAGGNAGSGGMVTIDIGGSSGAGGTPGCAATDSATDDDHDGLSEAQGDCNDCDAAINPGAYDFEANAIDEDCSGAAGDEPADCDVNLAIVADDPMDAAKSLGLCRRQQGSSWGLVAARWVFPNGDSVSRKSPLDEEDDFTCNEVGKPAAAQSRGVLPGFGPNVPPRQGASFVALSSGIARAGQHEVPEPGSGISPAGGMMCRQNGAPPGFPKDSGACPDVETAQDQRALDAIALELEIKTPTNARAFSFDFDFYTYEWPMFVCNVYNDFFVALLASAHPSTPADENISFDKLGNPVSVNNGFVEVCDSNVGRRSPSGKFFECALGTTELIGTGFDVQDAEFTPTSDDEFEFEEPMLSSHAATGWLKTTAAIVPGETIRLRFAIWDMQDQALDSTVLLDHFTWELIEPTTPVTERIPPIR